MSALITTRTRQLQRIARDFAAFNVLTDVPNLLAWYRADTTVNAGGFVSQLTDKHSGGFHYTQVTGSKQPALTASDSDMGGRASISFDGVDDGLTRASPGFGALTGLTVYMVVRGVIAETAKRYFSIGNSGTAETTQLQNTSASKIPRASYERAIGNITVRAMDTDAVPTVNDVRIFSYSISPTTSATSSIVTRARLGTPVTTNTTAGSGTGVALLATGTAVGSNTPSNNSFSSFTFAEMILASSVHTLDQMRKIELYLAGYYGLL
jgi:hypothetical protein